MRAPGEWSPSFMAFSPGCVNCGVPLGMERRQVPPTRSHSPSIEREGQVIYSAAFHHESGRLKVTLDLAGLESLSERDRCSISPLWGLSGTSRVNGIACVCWARPDNTRGVPLFWGENPLDWSSLLPFSLVSCVWAHPALPRVALEVSLGMGGTPGSAGNKQPIVVSI